MRFLAPKNGLGLIARPGAVVYGNGEYVRGDVAMLDIILAKGSGARIALSAATVLSSATVGTVIGALSVLGGSGSYTFTLTSNPSGLFSIVGSNLEVAASLSIGSDPITVHADNGAGSVLNISLLITVTNGSYVPTYFILGF